MHISAGAAEGRRARYRPKPSKGRHLVIQVEQLLLVVGAYGLLALISSGVLLAVALSVGLVIEFAGTHRRLG